MKKYFAIVLCAVVSVAFGSCGTETDPHVSKGLDGSFLVKEKFPCSGNGSIVIEDSSNITLTNSGTQSSDPDVPLSSDSSHLWAVVRGRLKDPCIEGVLRYVYRCGDEAGTRVEVKIPASTLVMSLPGNVKADSTGFFSFDVPIRCCPRTDNMKHELFASGAGWFSNLKFVKVTPSTYTCPGNGKVHIEGMLDDPSMGSGLQVLVSNSKGQRSASSTVISKGK